MVLDLISHGEHAGLLKGLCGLTAHRTHFNELSPSVDLIYPPIIMLQTASNKHVKPQLNELMTHLTLLNITKGYAIGTNHCIP